MSTRTITKPRIFFYYCRAYGCHCSNEIINFETKLGRVGDLLQTASILYHNDEDTFGKYLCSYLEDAIIEQIHNIESWLPQKLEEKTEKYKIFVKNYPYGYNSLQILSEVFPLWSPIFAKVLLNLLQDTIEKLVNEIMTSNLAKLDNNDKYMLKPIYLHLLQIADFDQNSSKNWKITYTTIFTPWLEHLQSWALLRHFNEFDEIFKLKKEALLKCKKTSQWGVDQNAEKEWAQVIVDIKWVFERCFSLWDELKWPKLKENDFGLEFFEEIIQYFRQNYVKTILEIVMEDQQFDSDEFVLVINHLFMPLEYLEEKQNPQMFLQKLCQKYQNYLYDDGAGKITDHFCNYQKTQFHNRIKRDQFISEHQYDDINDSQILADHCHLRPRIGRLSTYDDTENVLGYLRALLKFLESEIKYHEIVEKRNFKKIVQERLFGMVENEVSNTITAGNETKNQTKRKALTYMKEFQEAYQFKESQQLHLKSASTQNLIKEFYSKLDLSNCSNRGRLKFSSWKLPRPSEEEFQNLFDLKIYLKSVSDLVPRSARKEDNLLNFSISFKILPLSCENPNYKDKTEIILNKNQYLFDSGGPDQDRIFTFEKLKSDDIVQIILYDHSRTNTYKVFRGMYLLPVHLVMEPFTNFTEEETRLNPNFDEQVDFKTFPKITKDSKCFSTWEELCSRKSFELYACSIINKFHKQVEHFTQEKKIIKRGCKS